LSALDRLKEKVEAWKARIRELEETNRALGDEKNALAEELRQCREGGVQELESLRNETAALKSQLEAKEEIIAALRTELETKDAEIEAIIAKVEALLE
jgi:archaellum component FlaC